jgi:hypothetical protein
MSPKINRKQKLKGICQELTQKRPLLTASNQPQKCQNKFKILYFCFLIITLFIKMIIEICIFII